MPSSTSSSDPAGRREEWRSLARFALRCLAFWLVALVPFSALERYSHGLFPVYTTRKYADMFGPSSPETIILGSSRGTYGIDPRLLEAEGIHAYNFSYHASNPVFYRSWYRAYRRYHPAPRQVIYAVDWFMLSDIVSRRFEQDSEYFPLAFFLSSLVDPTLDTSTLLANRYAMVKFRGALINKVFRQDAVSPPEGDVVTPAYFQGYVPVPVKTPRCDTSPLRYKPLPEQRQAFLALLDVLAADHARLVFVAVPEYLPGIGEHPAENQDLEAIASQRRIPFLNYNGALRDSLNTTPTCFRDRGHLNAQGAERFGRRLALALKPLLSGVATAREAQE